MSGLLASQVRRDAGQAAPAPPPPPDVGILEGVTAAFRVGRDELEAVQDYRLNDAYSSLIEQYQAHPQHRPIRRGAGPSWWQSTLGSGANLSETIDVDALFAHIAEIHRQDPDAFPGVPLNRLEFERQVLSRNGDRQSDQRAAAAAPTGTGLVGGIAAAFTDPINILTLPIGGGGRTVLQSAAREALVNGAIELAQAPDLVAARARLGEETSAGQIAANVGFAAAGGAVLGGLGRGFANWLDGRATARNAADMVRAHALLPDAVRERFPTPDVVPDSEWAALARRYAENSDTPLTGDVATAAEMVSREQEFRNSSPFDGQSDGASAHYERLREAMALIMDDAPAPSRIGNAGAVDRRTRLMTEASRPAIAVSDPGVSGRPARVQLMQRIRRAESGGSDTARNPRSSATGRYQFVDATWVSYYRRRFGNDGRSDAAILALRSDGRLQDLLMGDLTADNARHLERAGIRETAGNLYLAHFAGPEGAVRLHRADPSTPVAAILGARAVRSNPHLRGMTAGDVIAWAHRTVGDSAGHGGSSVRPRDYDPEDDVQAMLAEEMRAIEDSRAALRAGDDGAVAAVDDAVAAPARNGDQIDDASLPIAETEPPLPAADIAILDRPAPPPRVEGAARQEQVADGLARLVEDGRTRLNDMERLVRQLDASEPEIRAAQQQLARAGRLIVRDDGRVLRVPRRRDPANVWEFIASIGGIHPSGLRRSIYEGGVVRGHDLATVFQQVNGRPKFVPGYGPLLRDDGLSIDDIGEHLWSGGWLYGRQSDNLSPGEVRPRPTESEVLEFLETAHREGVNPRRVADELASVGDEVGSNAWLREQIGEWERYNGYDLADAEIAEMIQIMDNPPAWSDGVGFDDAYAILVARRADAAIIDAWRELSDDPDYAAAVIRIAEGDLGEGGGGRAIDADGAGPRGADAGAGRQDQAGAFDPIGDDGWPVASRTNPADPMFDQSANMSAWDDGPAAGAAQRQSDSVMHDMRAIVAQGGDSAAVPVRIGVEGEPRTLADIIAEIDDEAAALRAIKDCL